MILMRQEGGNPCICGVDEEFGFEVLNVKGMFTFHPLMASCTICGVKENLEGLGELIMGAAMGIVDDVIVLEPILVLM